MRLRILVFSLLCCVAGTVLCQDTLSVEQAIEIALKNNFDIQIAKNDADIAHINNNPGNAGMLPKLNANLTDNFTYTNLDQKLSNGTEIKQNGVTGNSLQPGLALSWTLFDGLKMFATKNRLKQLEEVGRLNLKDTLQTMVAQVINAYYNVVSARQQLRSITETIALYEETAKIAEKQFQVGTSSKVAMLQAKVDLNADKSQALAQKTAIEESKAVLNGLLGRAADTEFEVEDSIPFNVKPDLQTPDELEKNNYQIEIARRNIEIARYAKKETFAQMLPNLTLGGGVANTGYNYNRTQSSAGFSLYNQSYGPSVGFTLTVPIFNGLVYLHQTKVAEITILNNQFKLQKVTLQNRINYYNAMKNFETAKEALQLEEENIGLAKENVSIALERFRVAESTAIELRQAQQSYVEALTRLVNARYNAKAAETELLRIQGKLVN
ncbi:MAG TPA: TolC family protein [Chitinophagales bacterium]|nr:TolC family protein [Chitinophagales bacterium]